MEGKIVDLNTFADGAVSERFNIELQRVLENFADLNTDPKAKRSINLVVTLRGDDARDVLLADVQAKTKLAPAKKLEAKIIMDLDETGKVTGSELKSGIKGQTYIDVDTGDIQEDNGNKVYSFRKTEEAN